MRAHCQQGCKHGECVGPDRCKCHPGYTGKACNQDLNECGLKPRPCKHRCMNTPGSYKCYCLDGYTLQPDGSCRNARTCYHANCQYGCEVSKGAVQCTCPSPGLRLGPDRRTCVDIDECVSGGGVCPRHRKCVNTFGSFMCKCHLGFKLTYINGRYICIDKDTRPFCSLNPSSPKCRCKDGSCKAVPKVTLEPQKPRTTTPITTTATTPPPLTTMTTTPPVITTTIAAAAPASSTAATKTETTTPTPTTTTTTTTTTSAATTTTATTITTASAATTTAATTTTASTTTAAATTITTITAATTTSATTTTAATAATITTAAATTTSATAATTTAAATTTSATAATTTAAATTTSAATTTAAATTTSATTTTAATTATTTTAAATTTTSAATTAVSTIASTTVPSTTLPAATTTTTPLTSTTIPSTMTPVTTTQPPPLPTTELETTTPTNPATSTTIITATTTVAPTTPMQPTTIAMVSTTLNNRITKDVTHKQRGDVHIPRHPDHNNHVWEFDIELGNTAEDARDDPEAGVLHCTFDQGVCDWLSDRDGDLHWETSLNPAGGRYLSVPQLKVGQRSIRGARLAVQIVPPWSLGDLCFSFSHWLTGHHVGVLQLFTRKKGRDQRYSPALWSRTGGHGWRHTQVTLTTHSLDRVVLKAERRQGRRGQIAVDDVTLRQGACR
ncbi:nephronectin-like isoform X2 [Seriola aureovittata]|uniref:nephronectin-like isoform X2 n=1 Tax=Seriola aureovittata TaxID=2871759 RepID=UPI0024BD8F82|nr:nephronectin-like isoform X2 [Seriola aureovittata]